MPPEASSTEQVATPPDAYNAMASAFDELLVPEKTAAKPADPPSTTEVDAAAAAAKAPETPPADAAAPKADAPAEGEVPAAPAAGNDAPAAAPAAADAAPPADTTDWKAKFEELQAQQREQPEPAPEPKPAAAAPPAQPERPIYTEDEKAFLKEYEAELGHRVARGVAEAARGVSRCRCARVLRVQSRVRPDDRAGRARRGADRRDGVALDHPLGAPRLRHGDVQRSRRRGRTRLPA
jgi:hypothetical protein